MRILAIAFSLALVGCVDEGTNDTDPSQEELDEEATGTDDPTDPNLPDTETCGNNLPGGKDDGVSRKKADGDCF